MSNPASIMVKSTMKYGLYVGVALVSCSVLFYLGFNIDRLGLMQYLGLGFLFGFAPMVAGIVLSMKYFRDKDNGGFMTYGEGLRFGTQLMLFAGIIMATYSLIFNTMIVPGYDAHVQEMVMEKTIVYLEKANLPDAEIERQVVLLETAVDEARKTSPLKTALWSIPQTAMYGFVISLVVAAIFKRKKDPFAQAMNEIKTE